MKTRDFHYDLPERLIAQQPCAERSSSRLLHYSRDTDEIRHLQFRQIVDLLNENDLLVFNNTRVIPARLYGHKETGGKVEVLIERFSGEHTALAHIRASKTPKPGTRLILSGENGQPVFQLNVEGRDDDLFILHAEEYSLADILESIGHMPLPPYISREDNETDFSRYQTVYAQTPGAVAAPTAGLHFDQALLEAIADKGVASAYVTLHVGAGTFQPVRSENIEEHEMHTEYLVVPEETVAKYKQAREQGGRIIAVGTTSVRSLETASQSGRLQPFTGETDIFIYPGYRFHSVDALITNFHLPESTLLMLISAFAGKTEIDTCYREAIEQEYRFFSYGDAMFIS